MKINEVITYGKIKPGKKLSISPEEVNNVINFIKKKCKNILSIYEKSDKILFRGSYNNDSPIFLGKPFKNRIPKDTYKKYQIAIDNKLSLAGFTALRSNSIFVSANESTARAYGTAYAIFPIDGFSYMWADKVSDLTSSYGLDNDGYNSFKEDLRDFDPKDFVDAYNFKNNTGIEDAMLTNCEICINGPYVAIEASHGLFEVIMYGLFGTEKVEPYLLNRLSNDGFFLQYIKNPNQKMIFTSLKKCGFAIQFIPNPTYEMKVAALQQNGNAIQYISDADERLQLLAVQNNCYALHFIKNPSEKVKYTAVKSNGAAIEYIDNPSSDLILLAVKTDPYAIAELLRKGRILSDEILISAINKSPSIVGVMLDSGVKLSPKLQLVAVRGDGINIRYIKGLYPSGKTPLKLQLIAVANNIAAIQWCNMSNKAVQLACIKNDPEAIWLYSGIPWCDEARKLADRLGKK